MSTDLTASRRPVGSPVTGFSTPKALRIDDEVGIIEDLKIQGLFIPGVMVMPDDVTNLIYECLPCA